VSAVTEAFPDALPLIISTGDNGLHTGTIIQSFCDQLDLVTVDGALGLTDARYVLEKYPDGARAFHRFRDGAFSSCNLYAFLSPSDSRARRVFNGGGQFGKKPKRLIGAFGLLAFLVYKSRLVKVRPFIRFLSRAIGVQDGGRVPALRRRPDRHRPDERLAACRTDPARARTDRLGSFLQIPFEVLAASDPLAVDEDLRRGLDALLFLERIDCLACRKHAVIDFEAVGFEHFLGADAKRAVMVGKDHSGTGRAWVTGVSFDA
jgi:hypothetical protein